MGDNAGMKPEKSEILNIDLETLLPAVLKLAQQAGVRILDFYQVQNLGVALKSDSTPVTSADLAAHDCIQTGLTALRPHWPVLSEEGELLSFTQRAKWSEYWLVDPLDGTKGFLAGNDEFTVNIALIIEGRPVLGVIYSPVDQVAYFAAEGIGAFKQLQTRHPQRIKTGAFNYQDFRVLTARRHIDKKLQQLLQALGSYERIALNSSLKLGLLSEGLADFYPRLHPISEWDIAAGHCILQEAGGDILDLNLETIRYNTKDTIIFNGFIAVADRNYDWEKLREFLI